MSDKKHYAGAQWGSADRYKRSKEKRPVLVFPKVSESIKALLGVTTTLVADQDFQLDGEYILSRQSMHIFAGHDVIRHVLWTDKPHRKVLLEWVTLENLNSLPIPDNIKKQIRPILTVFEMQRKLLA